MVCKNLTTKTVISTDLKEANSFSDRFLGLLKKTNPRSLFFKTRFGLQTFLQDKPIDVLVLDNKFRVIKTTEMLPNRLFFYNPKYPYVLELPQGAIKKSKTKVGDILKINGKD